MPGSFELTVVPASPVMILPRSVSAPMAPAGYRDRASRAGRDRAHRAMALTFGLLHGFGFASALSDIGLPQGDIPLALFAFNVGVECGQLAFVAVVSSLAALPGRLRLGVRVERYALGAAPYAIGTLAAFWFFERLAKF